MTASYHHGNLREALIAATEAVIARDGAAAVTLREVARVAGVSHAAPYHHFRDKDALIAAVAERGFVELAEALEGARGRTPRTRLLASCDAYEAFARAHPARFAVMFGPVLASGRHPALAAAAERAFAALLAAAQAVSPGRAVDLALATWSLVHGHAKLALGGALTSVPVPAGATTGPASRLGALLLDGVSAPRRAAGIARPRRPG
ncbi:MAG: TetR/AcrR family transcriptional regulator [Myxococcales bacterium]|nr:TetR/AcrR family transcriptional regulator [Myxococcales bacterium]